MASKVCPKCNGTGICPDCDGTGIHRLVRDKSCPSCCGSKKCRCVVKKFEEIFFARCEAIQPKTSSH